MTRQYTYDSGGTGTQTRREQLADWITILSPMDTPLHNMLEQPLEQSTSYDWMVDEIVSPTSVSAKLEGATPSATTRNRQRLRNIMMIDHEGIDVSDTQRTVEEAAVADEFAWQIVQKGLELLKRAEFNAHWSTYQAGAAATERKYAGLLEWAYRAGYANLTGSVESIAGTSLPVKYGGTLFEGTNSNLTESQLRDQLLAKAWRRGMEIPNAIALMGALVKTIISDFGVVYGSGSNVVNAMFIEAEKKKKILTIDVFETDFGPLSIAMDRYLDDSAVSATITPTGGSSGVGADTLTADEVLLLFEPEYVDLPQLRPLQYSPLAKSADASLGYVVIESGLRVKNPIATAIAIDVSA